jgi:hypothetical protein
MKPFLVMVVLLLSLTDFSAAQDRPAYVLKTAPARRVRAVLTFNVKAPKMNADEWIVLVARPPVLPCQVDVQTKMEPAARPTKELSPRRQPILIAQVPAKTKALKTGLQVRVTIEATLMSRQLTPLPTDAAAPHVAELPKAERRLSLAKTPHFNFDEPAFQRWLEKHHLHRKAGESAVALARRVFQVICKGFRYQWPVRHKGSASATTEAGRGDCGCLATVFVSALRANGIPARLRVGRWAQSVKRGETVGGSAYYQTHAQAEFYADGIGWVPADPTLALIGPAGQALQHFGNDPGNFLTLHLDSELQLNTVHFGVQYVDWLQDVAYWARGARNGLDGSSTTQDWQVQELPR